MASRLVGWVLALLAGAVWGVAFFSWGLPLSIPARAVATLLLVGALAVASAPGRLAAGAFALGMGVSSSFVVLLSGDLFEWWMLVPVIALLGAAVLHALSIGFLRGG